MKPIFVNDPLLAGTFYTGAGFLAEINYNPDCIYYTTINQDRKTLNLVECLPGVYNRVVLASYDELNQHMDEDFMDYSDTASYRLAAFLNGRRICATTQQTVEFAYSEYAKLSKKFYSTVEFAITFIGVKMSVSIIIINEYFSEGDNPKERIDDAINVAVAFRFDPISQDKEERNN